MVHAYDNLPLAPSHKPYVASMWRGRIYVDHCMMEVLSSARNIQGSPADALVTIFDSMSIGHAFKWVDDLYSSTHLPHLMWMQMVSPTMSIHMTSSQLQVSQFPLTSLGIQLKPKARISTPLFLMLDSSGTKAPLCLPGFQEVPKIPHESPLLPTCG